MKILIATPLYPPDIAGHAQYVKELSRRLSEGHEVTVLTYNHIPEKVPNVSITTVPKMLPAFIRIIKFTLELLKAQRTAGVIYFQNGPSVEIPLIIASLSKHPPYLLRLGDETPLSRASREMFYRWITAAAISRSHTVMTHCSPSAEALTAGIDPEKIERCTHPVSRPEVLPFSPYPQDAMDAYESSWREHVHYFLNVVATALI